MLRHNIWLRNWWKRDTQRERRDKIKSYKGPPPCLPMFPQKMQPPKKMERPPGVWIEALKYRDAKRPSYRNNRFSYLCFNQQICRKLWSWSGYPSLTLAGELIHWLLTLIIFTILSNYQIQCKVRTPIRAFNCQRHFPDFIAVPNNLALIMIPSNPSSTKRRKIK